MQLPQYQHPFWSRPRRAVGLRDPIDLLKTDVMKSIKRYTAFKAFEKRILVATDIFGRGIDVERVNIVVNYDCPPDADSYLHRVGRAGRFGTKGLAITFVSSESDQQVMAAIQSRFEVAVPELPEHIDPASYSELVCSIIVPSCLFLVFSDIVIDFVLSPCALPFSTLSVTMYSVEVIGSRILPTITHRDFV